MILNGILANMGAGISGAASKTAGNYEKMVRSNAFQVIAGKHEHNAKIDAKYKKLKDEGERGTGIKATIHKGIDNFIAADYKGQGVKRAGVIAARQGFGIATSIPIEAGIRYATGSGTLTQKDGERDIAGIPFV